jgi:dTDP-glucose 4,6-dehydratase
MNFLITGGLGFIGSNFIRYILNKYPDYKITNLDIVSYCANFANLRDIENSHRYKFVKGDICNSKKVERVIKTCDCVVNFAAQTHVDKSIISSDAFIKTNVWGAHNLLNLAKRYKVGRFIQISTDEVYGSVAKGKADENSPLNPSSPYAASKASADLIAISFYKTFKTPLIITRSSNNFGPYQYPEKVIPLFITNIIEGKTLPLYGKGSNIRDWIFVDDNCRALDLVLQKGKIGQIYNIGADNYLDNLSLAKLIIKELGAASSLITFVKDRLGHDYRYAISSEKIRRLGFRGAGSFRQRLIQTINWYINNCTWWKPLKRS